MIFVNDEPYSASAFPDGTPLLRFNVNDCGVGFFNIRWLYDNDAECMTLWHLVHHIRSKINMAYVSLDLPYIPNARMDRVKSLDEVFTLKWFAEFLNALHFDSVWVLDPHSNVSTALINNVRTVTPEKYVRQALTEIPASDGLVFCYPDEGAAKRYSELFEREYVFGIKHRDWRTGKIERLELTTPEKVRGRDVLIIDDICSRGGTFTFTAKALKEAGANHIYLFVTHCENTIFQGSVLTDGLIDRVFTTNSIFRGTHDNITVFEVNDDD